MNYDRMLTLSLIKSIEIIGEAAARTSTDLQDKYPNIPWKNIIGMRNRLIHAYFDINLDVLWNTIKQDLPPLLTELEKVIEQESKIIDPKTANLQRPTLPNTQK